MVAKAPSAAVSVGVAQPTSIAPTTMPKIDTSGITYFTNGWNFCQPWYSSNFEFGASSGLIFTRRMM